MSSLSYVVAKPFNTVTRRLRQGDPVSETDDLSPHSFEDLKARRWIVSDATKTGTKAVRAGDRVAGAEAEAVVIATQDDLRRTWELESPAGGEPQGRWAIHIADEDLFGTVVYEEGAIIGVDVPGEQTSRFYRVEAVDRIARTVSGKYSDSSSGIRPPKR